MGNHRQFEHGRQRARTDCKRRLTLVVAALSALSLLTGCVTVAEFRKLEKQVMDLRRSGGGSGTGGSREALADAGAEIDRLDGELRQLSGRLEETQRTAEDALVEARKARMGLAAASGRQGQGTAGDGNPGGFATEGGPDGASAAPDYARAGLSGDEIGTSADELAAYRSAYGAWRSGDNAICIDRFRKFLQTYPASPYADDSAFWMADCHYKQGDFKNAVLRFDDVVRNYPTGNKAPDALFRQGESLLKLGPGFHEAAKRAFERVLKEYPNSTRVEQAHNQLDMLGNG